jgi:hypothetical protein
VTADRTTSNRYAAATSVSADRSRAEIERTLTRYGARGFMYGWDQHRAVLGFVASGRNVRFFLPMPDRSDPEFTRTPTGKPRSAPAAETAYDQAVRQRWRALALVIKAKLEAVSAGIVTFDEEFLAHLVLPEGSTVAEAIGAGIEEAYRVGVTPQLLPPAPIRRLEIEPPR